MPNEVKLTITAEDKTQAAIISSQKSLKKLENSVGNVYTKVTMMYGSMLAGIQAVNAVVATPIKAYMAQENAIVKMGLAMKNQGDYTREALKAMEDYSGALQKNSTFADENILALMANLKTYGMTHEEVKKATQVTLDFAAAKKDEGMSVTSAGDLIGKAYAGNTATLSRYGIVLDSSLKGAKKFEAVMALLQNRFGGAAQAELLTYEGRWKNLQNIWGDMQEEIGLVFLKTIDFLTAAFAGLSMTVNGVIAGILQGLAWVSGALGKFARAVGLKGMADTIDEATSALDNMADHSIRATEIAQKTMVKNWNSAFAGPSVYDAVDKMQRPGQRTKPVDESGKDTKEKLDKELAEYQKHVDKYMKIEQEKSEAIGELALMYNKEYIEKFAPAKPLYGEAWLKEYLSDLDKIEKAEQEKSELIWELTQLNAVATEEELQKRALLHGDFFEGLKIGMKDWAKEQDTIATAGFNVMKNALDGLAETLTDFVTTGKADFKSLADSIVRDLVRIGIQKMMTNAIGDGKSGSGGWVGTAAGLVAKMFAADGAVFNMGRVQPFAYGGVVNRPTLFPMASGAGLMGEAGPEAIMPLKRGADGKLGVAGGGSGGETNSFYIYAVDAKSFEDLCRRNPGAITQPVLQSMKDNKTRTEFKRMMN